jgi:serine/threonine protein kinase
MASYPMKLSKYLTERGDKVNRRFNFLCFKQITDAVSSIYNKNMIHRDLKSDNIFMDTDKSIRVGDLGLAVVIKAGERNGCDNEDDNQSIHTGGAGTYLYLAPEQKSTNYNQKIDILALGLILLELFYHFETKFEKITLFDNIKGGGSPPKVFEKELTEAGVIKLMTNKDPSINLNEYKKWEEVALKVDV